jgi:hypothetical protein
MEIIIFQIAASTQPNHTEPIGTELFQSRNKPLKEVVKLQNSHGLFIHTGIYVRFCLSISAAGVDMNLKLY